MSSDLMGDYNFLQGYAILVLKAQAAFFAAKSRTDFGGIRDNRAVPGEHAMKEANHA